MTSTNHSSDTGQTFAAIDTRANVTVVSGFPVVDEVTGAAHATASTSTRDGWRDAAVGVVIVVAYSLTGRLGLSLAHTHDNATLFWPPTGIALAALVLGGRRLFPAVMLGSFIVNVWVGGSMAVAAGIAVGNTLEAVIGATLLRRYGFRPTLARTRDVILLIGIGGLLSTTVSAAAGVGILIAGGSLKLPDAPAVGLVWWLGDVGGAIVMAPIVFLVVGGRPSWSALWKRAETFFVLIAVLAVTLVAFLGGLEEEAALVVAFLNFPLLVWAGVRLGPRGTVVAAFVVAAVAVVGTADDLGPFASNEQHTRLLLLWSYVMALGACALVLAAAVAEREDADAAFIAGEVERHRIQAKLLNTQRLEGLGLLAGGIAHDFNNILVTVRGNAELLLHNDGVMDAALLEEIDTAAVTAAGLCQQLLNYAGKSEAKLAPLDVRESLAAALALVKSSFAKDVSVDLPTLTAPICVMADATQFRQVLMNVFLNAAEAIGTRPGRITVHVVADAVDGPKRGAEGKSFVRIDVSDDGVGMSSETLARIFDPFFTTKFTGRGLGLAAVDGILRNHGGGVRIESAVDKGTTFFIYMQACPPSATTSLPSVSTSASKTALSLALGHARFGATILLVDDEDAVRKVMKRSLEAVGHRVLEAHDGIDAIRVFDEHGGAVDAAVVDVTMPGRSGIEVLHILRTKQPTLAVILTSGLEKAKGAEAANAFLSKPFSMPQLISAVNEVLPLSPARQPRSVSSP